MALSVLLLLLATSAASPVLHGHQEVGGHSATTTLHEPNDSTGLQEEIAVWNSDQSDSGSEANSQHNLLRGVYRNHLSDGDYVPPQELNTVQGDSSWDDDRMEDTLWKFIVSPSGTYENDEQQPPVAVDKSGSPIDEFTDDPHFNVAHPGDSVATWEEDTASGLSGRNDSDNAVDVERTDGEISEGAVPAPQNATELGPEVGSELFEELLGGAVNETLRKVKKMLAGGDALVKDDIKDWRAAISRLRVKRSEDGSEDGSADRTEDGSESAEDLPVRSLNDIVDVFLIIARQSLEERGLDQVKIPPLERTFTRSLGVGTLRGFFHGDDGWVRRLTTVRRAGPVRLDRGTKPPEGEPWDLRTVSVATTLGLEELTVGFERYVADVRALPTVSGRLVADIDENAVLLNISFSKRDDDPKGCDVFLEKLEVQRLEGINLQLTGLGPLNWLLSRIATWLTNHSQDKVAAVVAKELRKIANKELQNIPCDADFITALSML